MNKYQKNSTSATTPVQPEAVSAEMAGLVGDMQEGLFQWQSGPAAGDGRDDERLRQGVVRAAVRTARPRTATRHGSEDGSVALGGRRASDAGGQAEDARQRVAGGLL